MISALAGFAGILIGIFLNEFLRRQNRIENYSNLVFERKLQILENLLHLINNTNDIATNVIEIETLKQEERNDIISSSIHELARFCDENELFISENLAIHCITLFMGVEDIFYIDDKEEKDKSIKKIRANYLLAKNMIRKESGIESMDKLFGSITKVDHSSPIIEYYENIKKELYITGKWDD